MVKNKTVLGMVGAGAALGVVMPAGGVGAQEAQADVASLPSDVETFALVEDLPAAEVDQLLSALNDSYEAAVLDGSISAGAGDARPFSAENTDIREQVVTDASGETSVVQMIVPAGTEVLPDGGMIAPKLGDGFALQAQGNWGNEAGAHSSCISGSWNGSYIDKATNCTVWSWWKLAEQSGTDDYWMIHAESALSNTGGYMRTKAGSHSSLTQNTTAANREFRPLSGNSSGCRSIDVNITGSYGGVGGGTSFPLFQACDQVDPINANGNPRNYTGVRYTGPQDGAIQNRELISTQVFRVAPSNNSVALIMNHSIQAGCNSNVCSGSSNGC